MRLTKRVNFQYRKNYCDEILGYENKVVLTILKKNHSTDDQENEIDEDHF